MFRETQGSLRCLAATILPPGAGIDQWVDQVSMWTKRMQLTNLCGAGCLQQRSRGLFKSDRGALSAKDERETLLTTRSSSEKLLFSVVLTSGVVESVIELFIRSLTS